MDLTLSDLSLTLDGKTLLDAQNLTIHAGDYVIVRGPSGAGKTSFLRLLNRLSEPTSGVIRVGGRPLGECPVTTLRRQVAYLQQTPIVVDGTVRDNLLLGYRFRSSVDRPPPSDDVLEDRLAAFLLEDVTLDDVATRLSIGQKQRIALIRTLLLDPKILLCDEPTSALDPDSRRVVENHLERINVDAGITVILVTHVDTRTSRVTPRHFTLSHGKLVEEPGGP